MESMGSIELGLADGYGKNIYATDDGWVYAANNGTDSNTEKSRRQWIAKRVGYNRVELSLADGRTWYMNKEDWGGVAKKGEFTNTFNACRHFIVEDEQLFMMNGMNVYFNKDFYSGAAWENEHTNTTVERRKIMMKKTTG